MKLQKDLETNENFFYDNSFNYYELQLGLFGVASA